MLSDGTYDNFVDADRANVEGAIRGFGGNDVIFGDIYQNPKETTEGDVAYGGDGDDRIFGDTGLDEPNWQYNTKGGSDTLYGENGNDRIYGQGGHDRLHGDAGNDLLVGGTGNDVLWADIENETYAAQSNNFLYGGTGNDRLYGGAGIDELYGEAGTDTLYGGVGNDDMAGGDGADILYGGAGDDILDGADLGASADGNDRLYGEAGNDIMNGGTGADTFVCGAGNDTYVIDNANDSLRFDYTDSGTDTVQSSVGWRLGNYQENLTLTGSNAIGGVGNDVRNAIRGNAAANTLTGNAGDDFLSGGSGKDVVNGGIGADDLYGGADGDTFVFNSIGESTAAGAGRDTIFDFTSADRINLSSIDANTKVSGNQAFIFIGTQDFTGKAGELTYDITSSDTYIYDDVNGDRKADFSIHLDDALALQKGYFVL